MNVCLDNLTVVIKTLIRYDCLEKTITKFREIDPDIKIIVIDDSPLHLRRRVENVNYIETDVDIGLSEGRNIGFRNAQTDFVLYTDDDQYPNNMSKVDILRVMEWISEGKADLIGWKDGVFKVRGKVLEVHKLNLNTEFYLVDVTGNSYIAKKEVLLNVPHDEDIKKWVSISCFFTG
jgi:glycosyltransferase involved in cell wall biosynthesis